MFKYIVIDNNTYQQIHCYTLCQILTMSNNRWHTSKSTQTRTKYEKSPLTNSLRATLADSLINLLTASRLPNTYCHWQTLNDNHAYKLVTDSLILRRLWLICTNNDTDKLKHTITDRLTLSLQDTLSLTDRQTLTDRLTECHSKTHCHWQIHMPSNVTVTWSGRLAGPLLDLGGRGWLI